MEDELNAGGRHARPQTEPGVVSTESGQVMLDGPNGVAVAMTPSAAAETGRRLIAGAEQALAPPR